jgi:hypothetical protein
MSAGSSLQLRLCFWFRLPQVYTSVFAVLIERRSFVPPRGDHSLQYLAFVIDGAL